MTDKLFSPPIQPSRRRSSPNQFVLAFEAGRVIGCTQWLTYMYLLSGEDRYLAAAVEALQMGTAILAGLHPSEAAAAFDFKGLRDAFADEEFSEEWSKAQRGEFPGEMDPSAWFWGLVKDRAEPFLSPLATQFEAAVKKGGSEQREIALQLGKDLDRAIRPTPTQDRLVALVRNPAWADWTRRCDDAIALLPLTLEALAEYDPTSDPNVGPSPPKFQLVIRQDRQILMDGTVPEPEWAETTRARWMALGLGDPPTLLKSVETSADANQRIKATANLVEAARKSLANLALDRNEIIQSLPQAPRFALLGFEAAASALGRQPTDRDAYSWIAENRVDEHVELPEFDAWVRSLRRARNELSDQKNDRREGRSGRSVVDSRQL